MTPDKIIKWTNRIALLSITLLIYWVFIFISITVFDFKVFRENITETFYLSVLAILALMSGSIVVNIMFNLTKISSAIGSNTSMPTIPRKTIKPILIFISFPLIFGLLYLGDVRSSAKKESLIKKSAKALVAENQQILTQFSQYQFTEVWRKETQNNLLLLEKIEESFPNVMLIIKDEIQGKPVYLGFRNHYYKNDTEKVDFIYSCSAKERAYLANVFKGDIKDLFSSSDGHYELYFPVKIGNKIIVLYLSERQRYGKLGS